MTDLNLNDVSVESLMGASLKQDYLVMSPKSPAISTIDNSQKSPIKLIPTLMPSTITRFPMLKD